MGEFGRLHAGAIFLSCRVSARVVDVTVCLCVRLVCAPDGVCGLLPFYVKIVCCVVVSVVSVPFVALWRYSSVPYGGHPVPCFLGWEGGLNADNGVDVAAARRCRHCDVVGVVVIVMTWVVRWALSQRGGA